MESSVSQKRLRSSNNGVDRVNSDRLSEMPDEVIVKILSFLPIVDAVRSLALRRFGNLWTLVPSLSFSYKGFMKRFYKGSENLRYDDTFFEPFSLFVRNVVMLHSRPTIDTFELRLEYPTFDDSSVGDDIRMWLAFALGREVKKLDFIVYCHFEFICPVLPVFASQSLVKLVLESCTIQPHLQILLESLKELRLEYVNVCNEGFQNLISGCPSLQELGIVYPMPLEELRLTAPGIVKLYLCFRRYESYEFPFVLDCPKIKILDLDASDSIPDVVDVSSVCEITINSLPHSHAWANGDKLRMLLEKLEGAKAFKLSNQSSMEFFPMIKNLDLPQNRWKRVVLDVWKFTEDWLLGFYQLARSLGHLEELIINTAGDQGSKPCTKLLPLDLSSPCLVPKLKTVTMHGCDKHCECQLQLVEFLLKSAVTLEMFRIVPGEHPLKAAEELEFVKCVSSFQRASSNARVLFT